MSKRKLTDQQQRRVESRRQRQTPRGRPGAVDDEQSLGQEQPGLVVARYGQQLDIEADDGSMQRCFLRSHLDEVVTGDRVLWRPGSSKGVVVAHLPRHSLLSRPDARGQLRPVAANIDRMLVVIAPQPQPHANLIDRYLVAAASLDITPVLLLNKSDLLDSNDDTLRTLLQLYQQIGYPVLQCSTVQQDGLASLRDLLSEGSNVLVGQSGVGKSSLIQTLLPNEELRIGELSEAAAKGRHTTTAARLYHLPSGGNLIDSPGIREFSLGNLEREQVAAGFIDFHPYLGRCRFRDCQHEEEPGCALRAAVAAGDIDPRRWNSYAQILASLS